VRFEQAGVLDFWTNSVSDDFSLTHALRRAGLSILFAPECIVPAIFDCDFRGLVEFTNRQIIITRVYEPKLWLRGGLGHILYCGAILSGVGLYFGNLVSGVPAAHLLLLAMAPAVLSMVRGALRLLALIEIMPERKSQLLADGWIWTLLAAVAPLLALWNTVAALFTREIRWRGIRYELKSAGQTRILTR
jgi:hypothetical protein